jgi:DNA transformation protein and related proteins
VSSLWGVPDMAVSQHFLDMILDALQDFGSVSTRRMFGGAGLFYGGVMFALITGETLYLKADEVNRPDFEDRGLLPFTYLRQGKDVALSFYEAPDDGFDDPDILVEWSRRAWEAAKRNKVGEKK